MALVLSDKPRKCRRVQIIDGKQQCERELCNILKLFNAFVPENIFYLLLNSKSEFLTNSSRKEKKREILSIRQTIIGTSFK